MRELAIRKTLSTFGRIDVLINNAGVELYPTAADLSRELFLRLADVNAFVPLAMAQLVLHVMRQQVSGTIVNVGSVAGSVALPGRLVIARQKAALHSIHDSLRRQV